MSYADFPAYLTADHRHCDEQLGALRKLALAADSATAAQTFEALNHDVLAHFAAEEEVLFPAFESATGMSCGPTQVMRMEHAEARELLADLAEAVSGQDVDGVRGHGEALLILLQQHNMKEENILYPMAYNVAGANAGELGARIAGRRQH
ncbi:MAG: hemerythrin HHE cation-binding protein [Candidatus Dactylopiibacterium carminicum]|uniref:Hemerythrin HHE cation-binding protein n=1 Tax=Candidatus Dactylopiibacterium carminicum TaxID=857335 RepID=A0A272EVM0_9RHOO|nr:hemerythrin domain-containing protein [Candidatus Dactylopiibacterium carminicum]KAF7599907.1 hemerythrin HHE cation-binding protein [Candidatus Dactylopiibacterium carminicum]PAS94154.1 MAG: hemerythrin HHE cation-binding protein [Candidatus Dactylopiibacterium carminicum]PAS96776.1 MAG: hemerythrin HHE cation-binding protein [Candidatus Dactylopiibacterium carminicum]PAS99909.1 MAG: hemerythrin HHE cation-binding protein [Candidatus Dactylopiibacterium carminicum]